MHSHTCKKQLHQGHAIVLILVVMEDALVQKSFDSQATTVAES